MIEYVPIRWPSNDELAALPFRKANEFAIKIALMIPDRTQQLESLVKQSKGFSTWRATHSHASFRRLGEWLFGSIRTESLPREEIERQQQALPGVVRNLPEFLRTWRLTPRSVSLAIDVGLYFANALRLELHDPNVSWGAAKYGPRTVYRHQPILSRDGKVGFMPAVQAVNLAIRMADGQDRPSDLANFYSHIVSNFRHE